MLVTKREVKQTSKKLLSVLLALVMMMTSMSVCFGTFVTASAEDVDYTQQLADKLKDGAYADTLALLGKGTKSGSKLAQKTEITFANYKNFKQAAELLRLVDGAMKQTEAWEVAVGFSNGTDGNEKTDQQAACVGKNAQDLYNGLKANLEKLQVTFDTNVSTFLGNIYHMDGATAHADNNGSNGVGTWVNTVTFSTSDYTGYLAQIGKAANVESSAEMAVQYVVTMGSLTWDTTTTCGTTHHYHHQIWPVDYAIDPPSTSATNSEMKSKVDAHIAEINSFTSITYAQWLERVNAGTADSRVTEFETARANAITYCGSQSTYDALYADYAAAVANTYASVDSAKAFQEYMPTVDAWNDFVDANPDYGVFQYDNFGAAGSATQVKLVEDFATFKAYRDYLLTGGSIYEYLVDYNYIDETYYTNFYDNVVAYNLQASKDNADALYNTYKDNYADLETEAQTIVYSELCGFINAIDDYSSQVVNSVYTSGSAYLVDLREALKCEINAAVLYFAENADKSFIDLSTAGLWDKINEAKGQNADLTTLYNEVVANVGAARADELLSAIRASATDMIENLYKTLADRFTNEVNAAYDLYVEMGRPTALKVDSFLKLSAVMVAIEANILTDLQAAGKAGYITQETIDRYNELMKVGGIYEIWNAYASTFGFPDYEKTEIKYDDRIPMEGDELKTANDPVTEAEMNNLITALDKIITSDLVGGLLGGLLNPDAEPGAEFDLGATLTDLIKGMLFTDDFINTVVKMLYPLVLNEFNKVWATLPITVAYEGIDVRVRYVKSLHDILDAGNFELYPDLLGAKLEELGYGTKYADNIAMLKAAGGEKDAWESSAIVDYENGEKLKLSWGVAEQKEKLDAGEITQAQFDAFFYQAFEDATAGLLPLLTTLITNVPWQPAPVEGIATGSVNIIINITLNVALQLGSEANQGYANMLVPIYELLGVPYTPVSQINGSTDVAYVLEQILKPIFTFLNTLGDKPVDTLLGILPNLVYALAFRMAKPMLNMLQTKITYDASANLVGSVLADGADVKVGDMLIGYEDDKMLKEDMFVGGLNTLLANFGLSIPAIDQATLATLGSLDKIDTSRAAYIYSGLEGTGKAYSITADKADVGYYLLSYLLNAVKDEATLTSLLGLFMSKEDENGEKVPDEEKMAGIKKVIYETLNLDEMNVGNVIAAIVELANQVEYDVGEYFWYDGSKSTPIDTTSATEIYLNPGNDWTEDKAEYLYNNLEGLLNAIFSMAGLDINVEEKLSDLLGGFLTNETVTKLAKLLGKLDINALLAGDDGEAALPIDINKLIKDELGIDLSVFAQYADLADDYDWGVTDAATFAAALANLLNPLKPVLDFILGGKDLTLIDSAITLQGYNGYDNAIIPLLEALGAAPAAYTDGADTLALTLNGLVGVINKLTTNDPAVEKDGAIYTIIDMLPGVIYYLSSNALSQGVDKLLAPVYALLDTIRPIYNVNLAELLAGIEVDLDKDGVKEPLGLDLKNLNWSFIFGLLNDLLGLDLSALQQVIYDVAKDIGVEYDSASALESTWKKGAYTADFNQADLLTVVLSFVLEWATVKENAEKLDELLKTDGIIASIGSVFASVEIAYGTPNWMYWFDSEEEFNSYVNGETTLPNTLAALDYPNNWTQGAAQYVADNLAEIVDEVVAMVSEEENVGALLNSLISDYINADTINELIGLITGLLADIDENLINTAGYLLGVDLAGLKAYTCTAEINSISDFAAELANVLDTYAGGLVNWLFFGDDYRFAKKTDGNDTIVINGGLGYEKGLALVLEALGCELPEEATVVNVLGALAARAEEILEAPVDEVLELLPNLIYFLNANGAGVAVDNLLKPVNALLDKLATFGLNVNLTELIGIDLANLSLANVVEIVEGLTDLDLEAVEAVLVDFCTGTISKGEYIYKMSAPAEDVITILLTTVLIFVKDADNEAALKELIGEDIYTAILAVLNVKAAEVQGMNWQYEDKADSGYVFSPIDGKDIENVVYGENYTREEAQYIADNFGTFVNNIINLIGININGEYVNDLSELLNGLVGGLYNSDNVIAIRDALAGLLEGIAGLEVNGMVVGGHILAVLKEALGVELTAIGEKAVPEFSDDKAAFIAALADVLDPLGPILNWILTGKEIAFFTDLEGEDIVVLPGAEGYKNGIVLLLEALGCENIVDPATLDENASGAAIVTAIIEPLLNRLDVILANPADEIFAILPNLVYFINSNGVDTVVKNTLNAVFAILSAIEPIAKVDLYELIGLDLSTLTFNELFDMLVEKLNVAGFSFEGIEIDALADLTAGTLESYDSYSSEETAYRMVWKGEAAQADMVTSILVLLIEFVTTENNQKAIVDLLKSIGMTAEGEKYVAAFIEFIATCVSDTQLGMDAALYAIYYVYYGVDKGASEIITGKEQLSNQWKDTLAELNKDASSEETKVGDLITDIFDIIFETDDDGENGVLDDSGVASNGFLSFFQKIAKFFQEIADFFRNLFSFGK